MKKEPLRKCVSCKEMKNKKELIRIVRNKNGEVSIDSTGKMNGRGAYLCLNKNCVKEAKENNYLSKSLKASVDKSILDEIDMKIDEMKI